MADQRTLARGIEPNGTKTARTIEREAMNEVIKTNLDAGGASRTSRARRDTLALYSELALEIADCGRNFREAGVTASDVQYWLISECRERYRTAPDSQKVDYIKEMRMMNAQLMACEIAAERTRVLSRNQFKQSDAWLHRFAGEDDPELNIGDQLSLADKSFEATAGAA